MPEHQTLVILMAAIPKDPVQAELHPQWNLDADGSYVSEEHLPDYAEDPKARSEHWLWTVNGFGPVKEMMDDPAK